MSKLQDMAMLCEAVLSGGDVPFSFRLDGASSCDFLKTWQRSATCAVGGDDVSVHTVVYRDPATGLECVVEFSTYPDSPAVEWVLQFRNGGTMDTPILSEVNALDMTLDLPEKSQPRLYSSKGTWGQIDDFALQEQPLTDGGKIELVSCGSRSHLPFFNLDLTGRGVISAIGWTGNWTCAFERPAQKTQAVMRGGMPKTHLRLHPGEAIRTPRVLVLFWQGERGPAHNLLRRHLIAHHLPRVDGRLVEAPVCNVSWGGMKTASHLRTIQYLQDNGLKYDWYWIDAGWYGPDHETEEFQNLYTEDWAYHIGHWRVNRAVHPDGLRPVVDKVHAAGMKLLLWFSPYSAEESSPLLREHPEWVLQENAWGENGIGLNKKRVNICSINIGIPEARRFLVEYLSQLIAEHGVDHFRDDGGLPLPPPDRDAPDRQGMGEIRAVEGFYAFWDELRQRHPGMVIDNCGGGGTRIDLETIGRSLVLHRTDYNCYPQADPIGFQVGTHGLSHWVPLVGGFTPARPGNTYNHRSAWCGGMPFSLFHCCGYGEATLAPAKDYPVEWHRKMLEDDRRVRPYLTGDFHPLTNCTTSPMDWFAFQMDRPDLGEGVVVAFRRPEAWAVSGDFRLQGLAPDAEYELQDADTGKTWQQSGNELRERGLRMTLETAPESRAVFYRTTSEL